MSRSAGRESGRPVECHAAPHEASRQLYREIEMSTVLEASTRRTGPYTSGLGKRLANYTPLSPLSFLPKVAAVHPNRIALIHGSWRSTWAQTYVRCRRLASALARHGVGAGDTVALMAPNVAAMYEAHFGVPMIGAVLDTLNIRLDAEAVAFQLTHGEAKVIITDREFSGVVKRALAKLEHRLIVIDIDDPMYEGGTLLGSMDYEAFLREGDPDYSWALPEDEFDPIALNYTSGTTGNPKGVVTHHRGAYLNAMAQIVGWGMPAHSVYLWTLPMFHCNGWCFPWAMAANAGTNVCLRRVDVKLIFEAIREHGVTHMCGAPIVYNMLISAPAALREGIDHKVSGYIAGAAPPASTIEGAERLGFELTHVYGLTETYGPASVCAKQDEWQALPLAERARLNARQGVAGPMQEAMTVLDPDTMERVPADGESIGEIMFRGNIIMNGYLKNPSATEEAFAGGWLHTGDLAVIEPDGYVRITDRSKDVIISGGENISSIEVEDVLHRHPAVDGAAVVAKPDEKWGEVACAFVELRPNAKATEAELRQFCREQMAAFKVPKRIVFAPIVRSSTGKIQKYRLREMAKDIGSVP
jgi:fatty-acyl-CoA synthase